ncbi:Zn-dependent hydrolase [Robiginitalea sp. SC105]|uniref:Zn-dependent hydrolase n=1 Tax=Robiginitalea sp. SC105 TaxID=2762332 RepID=UPI00163A835D|nr:Zn-dependent hydrolase [Robiginitalea sp. SC105]MBC2840173.1 Zn-dependent hydrolase [Robiginitalea sp. SC105]
MKEFQDPRGLATLAKSIILITGLLLSPVVLGQESPRVNGDRLEQSLMQLATFGRDEAGQPNRVAYSDGDIEGRAYVMGLMKEAGLEVRIDPAGNLIGSRPGTEPGLKPLAMGSHIDMVPHGGNYDGCVGSLSAIEVARTLKEAQVTTRHPLEVLIFTDEEGGVTGSRAMVGALSKDALRVTNSTGYTIARGIQRLGGDTLRLAEAVREKGSLAAYLELHIEQGGILEQEGIDIGVVQGIVGLNWWNVTVRGMANHAGTTPMNLRQDALLAAARFIQAVNEEALAMEGRQVATVGRIRAYPGAPNVIPGEVVLSLEIRDPSSEVIQALYRKIRDQAIGIASDSGTTFEFEALDTTGKPALTSPGIQDLIEANAADLGLSAMRMYSGAGHDAQDIAMIAPVGMIFVPSRGGISHSPDEFTSVTDMANGANVLLQTLLDLDQKNQ